MNYTLNLSALNDTGGTSPSPLPKMEGIVSDIPMPTESRKERIDRERAEAEAAKKAAKASKGQPVTKAKVSLVSADQTVTYTPDKEPFVLIDLPKLGRGIKKWYKKNKPLAAFASVAIIILCFSYLALAMNNAWDNKNVKEQAVPKSVEEVKITDKPEATTPTTKTADTTPTTTPTVSEQPKSTTAEPPADDHSITPSAYLVATGDTLWDIAENIYGDGSRWTEIYELNKDTINALDSRNITDHGHWIYEGITLQLE